MPVYPRYRLKVPKNTGLYDTNATISVRVSYVAPWQRLFAAVLRVGVSESSLLALLRVTDRLTRHPAAHRPPVQPLVPLILRRLIRPPAQPQPVLRVADYFLLSGCG